MQIISVLHVCNYALFTWLYFNMLGQVRNGQCVECRLISKILCIFFNLARYEQFGEFAVTSDNRIFWWCTFLSYTRTKNLCLYYIIGKWMVKCRLLGQNLLACYGLHPSYSFIWETKTCPQILSLSSIYISNMNKN